MAQEKSPEMRPAVVERPDKRPRVSKEGFERYLRQLSPEAQERRREKRRRYEEIRRLEDISRKEEEPYIATLEASLGIGNTPDVQESQQVLDTREQRALLAAIEESEDNDPDEVRDTFMYSLKGQMMFREQYAKWKDQYDRSPKLRAKMYFEDYVRNCGLRFLKENRHLIVRSRTNRFFKKEARNADMTDEEKREARKKIYQEVDMFIRANYDQLSSYNSMDTADQKRLFGRFSLKMTTALKQNGVEKPNAKMIEELFNLLVGDLEYEVIATQDYEASYKVMSQKVWVNMTEEEWEAMRRKAIEKNATGELKEYLQQQNQPLYSGPSLMTTPENSFSTVNDVAHASGVNLRAADPREKDLYFIDFPTIKDEKYPFMLKVVYPEGSTDINDAVFVIQQPWADKDAPDKGKVLRGKPTKTFKPNEVPRAINALILDYVLNRGLSTSEQVTGEPGINSIIGDEQMVFMAERLFGFSLDDKRILGPQIELFKRFLTVLLRDDGKSTLETRVKTARAKMSDDSFLPYFKKSLLAEGSTAKTMDAIIEEVRLRREGEIK